MLPYVARSSAQCASTYSCTQLAHSAYARGYSASCSKRGGAASAGGGSAGQTSDGLALKSHRRQ